MAIDLSRLSDDALNTETRRVARVERLAIAKLLGLLIEVERRGVHLALGYSSLFAYCTRALLMSEHAAYSRITAARTARRFPELIPLLADGALALSTVGLLSPHLTDETVDELLDASRHRSTREVEKMLANAWPQPDIPAQMRALPASPTEASAAAAPLLEQAADEVTAVSASDLDQILNRALTLLLDHVVRTKSGHARRSRRVTGAIPTGRCIPAAVRRVVWDRDKGRCVFSGADGLCGETGFLEFHHVVPFAACGSTDVSNLQLRCRAHNTYEAAMYFGTGAVSARH